MASILSRLFFSMTFAAVGVAACAQSTDGAWTFNKAVDYESPAAVSTAPPVTSVQFSNGQLTLPGNCVVELRRQDYYPGGPFQALLKSGESEAAIGSFLAKQFAYRLAGTKHYYASESTQACNSLGQYFLVSEDRLIAIRAGALFYSFTRSKAPSGSATISAGSGADLLQGLKPSLLPFKVSAYMVNCVSKLPTVKGVPQPTNRCASTYYPYVASRQSKETLGQLVGAHAYQKGGARNDSEDYNNPVANGLHPVFLVFPPLKDAVLVRVDDMERADARDPIKGAYLAIKGGQVTDQLNSGCSFDAQYICSDDEGVPRYRLLETGHFVKFR